MAVSSCRRVAASAALLVASTAALGQAPGWTIEPRIALRGTYTDNVSLAAAPERGEFVTQVSPGIGISGRTPRFTGSLTYDAHLLFYARERERDRIANTLAAAGTLEAVENFFFIDADSRISQNYASPFAPRPADITTVTDNRAETRSAALSPYVRGLLPGGYSYEVRNRNAWTTSDNDAIAKVHTRQWSASLASPIRLFGWSISGSDTNISREGPLARPDQDSRNVQARLIFQPDSTLRLYVSGGREENNFSLQQERSYDTYGYGALWQPTPRTTTQFDWNHRFFGVARSASFAHRTRLTAWNVTYSRDITNLQQELLLRETGDTRDLIDAIFRARIPDPVERARAVDEFLRLTGLAGSTFTVSSVFSTEQVFLQERLAGSMALIGARNSLTFNAFRSRSTSLGRIVGAGFLSAEADRVDQHGFGLSASHRLTPFTSLTASANRLFSEAEPSGVDARNDLLSLGFTHTLSPKTSTFAGATYTRFQSSAVATAHARSVFAGLSHRF